MYKRQAYAAAAAADAQTLGVSDPLRDALEARQAETLDSMADETARGAAHRAHAPKRAPSARSSRECSDECAAAAAAASASASASACAFASSPTAPSGAQRGFAVARFDVAGARAESAPQPQPRAAAPSSVAPLLGEQPASSASSPEQRGPAGDAARRGNGLAEGGSASHAASSCPADAQRAIPNDGVGEADSERSARVGAAPFATAAYAFAAAGAGARARAGGVAAARAECAESTVAPAACSRCAHAQWAGEALSLIHI